MSLTPSTFTELWSAWGPLLATVFGSMSLIIVSLVLGYREREREIRDLRDAALQREAANNERYIGLLQQVLAAMTRQAEAVESLRDGIRLEEHVADISSKVNAALTAPRRGGGQ